jgi:orotidine-5'-phosphate decarboxylase
MTPGEAVAAGADYIVVGRSITSAADSRPAALMIVEEMR